MPSFIEHRKRREQASISVIQEAVVKGVSTRKIEVVLAEFGVAGVSAGQASQLCASPDEKVRQFRKRPLGEIRHVWVDALYEKVREDERVESMAVVIAKGVNLEGRREVLGLDLIPSESEEGWAGFFKRLKERGLHGVRLVISDAHGGLKAAVRKFLKAEWQRCRVHFLPQRVGARAQAQSGRGERSDEGSLCAAGREKRQSKSRRTGAAVSAALRHGHGNLRSRRGRCAELLALPAAAPRADQFDQSAGAAESRDPAADSSGGHFPALWHLPTVDWDAARGKT